MNTLQQSEPFLRRVARVMKTSVPSRDLNTSDLALFNAVFCAPFLMVASLALMGGLTERGKSVDDSSDLGRELLALETEHRALPAPHSLENVRELVSARKAAIAAHGCEDKSFSHLGTDTNFSDLIVTFGNRVNWTCNTGSPSEQ